MNESFYGGRRGASFIIKKSYSSVNQMIEDFGTTNCEVAYDEYAFISNNNNDNGKIYRRVYGLVENNGAQYIGQIIGPAGKTPTLKLSTIAEIDSIPLEAITDSGAGSYTVSEGLVSGKNSDEIQWKYCSIITESGDAEAYIGFQLPYPVIEISARVANDGEELPDNLISESDESKNHPFYSKYDLILPRGISGNSFKNLRVVIANSSIEDYDGKEQDIANRASVLVYDYYDYSVNPNGDVKTIYLGAYNSLEDITFTDDGTLTFIYNTNSKTFENKIKWIISVSLANEKLTIQYNDNTTDEFTLIYPTDIQILNGEIIISYSDNTKKNVNFIYPTNINFNEENSKFNIAYSNNTTEEFPITYPTQVVFNETESKISIIYSNTNQEDFPFVYPKQIALDNTNNKFTVSYSNGVQDDFPYEPIIYPNRITLDKENSKFIVNYSNNTQEEFPYSMIYPTKIELDKGAEEGAGTQKISVTYSDGTSQIISNPINYIMEMAISDDYHLLALYSDPQKRADIITQNKNYAKGFNGRTDWHDLGAVKSYDGILIGKHYIATTANQLGLPENAISYLNSNFPNGLTDEDMQGKIVTITSDREESFYAFDYTYNNTTNKYAGWYYLGSLTTITNIAIGYDTTQMATTLLNQLPIGGIWLVQEE